MPWYNFISVLATAFAAAAPTVLPILPPHGQAIATGVIAGLGATLHLFMPQPSNQ